MSCSIPQDFLLGQVGCCASLPSSPSEAGDAVPVLVLCWSDLTPGKGGSVFLHGTPVPLGGRTHLQLQQVPENIHTPAVDGFSRTKCCGKLKKKKKINHCTRVAMSLFQFFHLTNLGGARGIWQVRQLQKLFSSGGGCAGAGGSFHTVPSQPSVQPFPREPWSSPAHTAAACHRAGQGQNKELGSHTLDEDAPQGFWVLFASFLLQYCLVRSLYSPLRWNTSTSSHTEILLWGFKQRALGMSGAENNFT